MEFVRLQRRKNAQGFSCCAHGAKNFFRRDKLFRVVQRCKKKHARWKKSRQKFFVLCGSRSKYRNNFTKACLEGILKRCAEYVRSFFSKMRLYIFLDCQKNTTHCMEHVCCGIRLGARHVEFNPKPVLHTHHSFFFIATMKKHTRIIMSQLAFRRVSRMMQLISAWNSNFVPWPRPLKQAFVNLFLPLTRLLLLKPHRAKKYIYVGFLIWHASWVKATCPFSDNQALFNQSWKQQRLASFESFSASSWAQQSWV